MNWWYFCTAFIVTALWGWRCGRREALLHNQLCREQIAHIQERYRLRTALAVLLTRYVEESSYIPCHGEHGIQPIAKRHEVVPGHVIVDVNQYNEVLGIEFISWEDRHGQEETGETW